VRVRVKSHTMAMLGEAGAARSAGAERQPQAPGAPTQGAEAPGLPIPNPAGLLKGLFGR
jgi:hypothetical protein